MKNNRTLRLILGDQLNQNHSWFFLVDDSVTYVLMEVKSETDYVDHHIQKVLGFFAAMRNFAKMLTEKGHKVIYIKINDPENLHSFNKNCNFLIEKEEFNHFEYQLPDEFRVDSCLTDFTKTLKIFSQAVDSEHFYTTRLEIKNFFEGKKTFLMESFYRYIRKKHKVLMANEKDPYLGKWNFDSENRKKLPPTHKPTPPFLFFNDLRDIEKEITDAKIKTIGTVNAEAFIWPTTREKSLQLLDYFLENYLSLFGTFQDAMAPGEWSIYHSRLSFSLNLKLISPKEVIDKVIEYYFNNQSTIEYNQVEGFVRQIIGWREYMRGIYWAKMPEYATLNFFENKEKLPTWFWNGNTKMNCLKNSIQQSLNYSYAHHIQRLMVTGNFGLLAGVDPNEMDKWYLGIYIDAIEWVEITNTRGMSQFADGGIVGTKPYVSSAAYINKMSSYCKGCYYNFAIKTGKGACPFNSLYWNFYSKNESKLAKNPRIGMMYSVWNKMEPTTKGEILEQAKYYLTNTNEL